MDDDHDDLLEALGRVARETPDAPDAWVEHAAGTLGPEERLALRGAAASDPRDRAALALLEPLGADFDEALTDRLLDEVAPAPAAHSPPDGPGGPPRWALLGGVALLAAAIVLGFGLTRRSALPGYQFDLQAGERTVRGAADDGGAIELFPDSRIALTLRPAEAVEGPVAVAAFVRQGSTVTRISPRTTCAPSGACKVEGIIGPLLGDLTGEATLIVVVGRPDTLPEAADVDRAEPRFERTVTVRTD